MKKLTKLALNIKSSFNFDQIISTSNYEKFIQSFEDIYLFLERKYKGHDPHQYLIGTLIIFKEIIGKNIFNTIGFDILEDHSYTFECACFPPPSCARMLAIRILSDLKFDISVECLEKIDIYNRHIDKIKGDKMMELYRNNNPFFHRHSEHLEGLK